jgi:hypothetical protein
LWLAFITASAVGGDSLIDVAIIALAGFFFAWFIPWLWSRRSLGCIDLSEVGIQVRMRGANMFVPWQDVTEISIKTPRDSLRWMKGLAKLLGVNIDEPFVSVSLNKRLKSSWKSEFWGKDRLGTRELGVPLSKKLNLLAKDPEAFVRDADDIRSRTTPLLEQLSGDLRAQFGH